MSREIGKALKDSRVEVARTVETLVLSAEEAVRIEGEQVPLDASEMGAGKVAFLLRFPVGVVAGITPYNAPLNLACHKIGPALAAGNAIVLKAPPQAPGVVYLLSQLCNEVGLPAGSVNVLYGDRAGPLLVRHPHIDFITFTGSSRVGLEIKAASGLRRVALELGGNGTTLVHDDANIAVAAGLCARNSMRLAGQSCISVQNVHVHEHVLTPFIEELLREVEKLRVGDPLDPDTDIGPLVNEAAAARVLEWIDEARREGAALHTGGNRKGALVSPTVLTGVTPSMRVFCNEIFGPVVSITPYTDLGDVFKQVNESEFGLHFGVFTKRIDLAWRAIREVRVGGIIVNGTTTWRTDQMPYGGIKSSGIGREGPRYAIREMTDERLVVFNV
jgi:acyl-CoA reductase-like NAD-dependent aldehyde dehydrogenase